MRSVAFETATHIGGKFSGDDHFELLFERNFDLPCVCAFLRERPRGQSVLAVGYHSLMHVLGRRINRRCMGGTHKIFIEKRA